MADGEPDYTPDIDQDLAFSRREWRVERVGWVVIALLVLAGLLGLLGRGPLTEKVAQDAAGQAWVEYYSIDHAGASSELRLHVERGVVAADQVWLTLNAAYLDRIEIESIAPEPAAQQRAEDGIVFGFYLIEPGQPVDLSLQYHFIEYGRATGEIRIEGGPQLSFSQFVLP